MSDKFFYYKISEKQKINYFNLKEGYTLKIFKPSIFKLNNHNEFKLIYFFWYVFTFGRYQIYYILDKEKSTVHFSHVMPKFFKYPFIDEKDNIHIGPCWTSPNHRGQGIYPAVLSQICLDYKMKTKYIFCEQTNIPSQKGIEKVGFKKFATGNKSKYLGIYKIAKTTVTK